MTQQKLMHAMVYEEYGDPSVLHAAQRPVPNRLPGQVVIEVAASSVNPIDYRLRNGEMKGIIPFGFPRIPGYDVSGIIHDCSGDDPFSVGDRVMAFLDHTRGGGCAEFAVCAVRSVARIPNDMPMDEAAAIPLAGSTALQSLRDHGKMQAGQRVLINGASGGVGMFAVQIAKACGCTVDAVASGHNETYCRSLGADRFFDYEQTDFTELDERWDLIFDAAGKSDYLDARKVLDKNGRYVTTEPDVKGMLTTLLTWPLSKTGKTMLASPRDSDLRELIDLWSAGKLHVTFESRYSLDQLVEAHRRVEDGVDHGKVVVLHRQIE